MLYPEREAIVQKLVYAYLNLKRNNYVFAGTGTWIDAMFHRQLLRQIKTEV